MALSKKDLELIKEVSQQNDRDSFSGFQSGLRNNWQIIMFIGACIWLLSQFANNITARVDQVEGTATRNTELVQDITNKLNDITTTLSARIDEGESKNNEIIRKLDALQTDVEYIRAK